jgi:hypothetical protein
MEKQTAVEWFYQRILAEDIKEIFQQAKAMEKEQIETAYQADRYPCSEADAEQYYTETYSDGKKN